MLARYFPWYWSFLGDLSVSVALVGSMGSFGTVYNWDFGVNEGGEGVYLCAKCEYVSIKVWWGSYFQADYAL